MKLNTLHAHQLGELLHKNETSVTEIVKAFWQVIEEKDTQLKAWEHLNKHYALEQAERLDKKRQTQKLGLLGGIPVGVKDIFNTQDFPTEMGSEIWKGFTPGNDARTVHYVREQDAVIMGKTVTAEFAVHYLSANKTRNPHNPEHIPGTSSSGSAAAVATQMVPLALGTQTAGSIIRPASFCGVHGFKPTFGLVPRTGILKTTDTLDTVGGFANSIEDLKLLFEVIRVKGRDFPIAEQKLKPQFQVEKNKKIKVGFIIDGLQIFKNFPAYSLEAFENYLKNLGKDSRFALEKINLPKEFDQIHQNHSIIYDKTLSYYFKHEFEKTNFLLSQNILQAIEKGKDISSEQYIKALEQQSKIRLIAEKALEEYDFILCLSTAGEAPVIGKEEFADLCLIWTFLGMPALSMPIFKSPSGLPFGLQIVAKRYDDYQVVEYAKLLA